MCWPAWSGKPLPIPERLPTPPGRPLNNAAGAMSDAFAYLGATVFTGYFLNYAQTELDL
jgi:hypothetical protein